MPRFSVWDYGTKSYQYYDAPSDGRTHAGTPPRARGSTSLGSTPEQAAWRVPTDARRVGQGPTPQGRIASLGGIEGGALSLSPLAWLGIGAGAYFLLKKRRRK